MKKYPRLLGARNFRPSDAFAETLRRKKPTDPKENEALAFHHLRTFLFRGIARVEEIDKELGVVTAVITVGTSRKFERRKLRLTMRTLLMGSMASDEITRLTVGTVLNIRTFKGIVPSSHDYEITTGKAS